MPRGHSVIAKNRIKIFGGYVIDLNATNLKFWQKCLRIETL